MKLDAKVTRAARLLAKGVLAALALYALTAAVWAIAPIEFPAVPEFDGFDPSSSPYDVWRGPCAPDRLAQMSPGVASDDIRAPCFKAQEDYRFQTETLKQSTRSAVAANEGVKLSFQQTRIGFVQAVLSVLTALAAGWAALEAGRAAKAARAAVDDARSDAAVQADRFERQLGVAQANAEATRRSVELSVAQLRPSVTIVHADIQQLVVGQPVAATVQLQNTGSSVALRIRIVAHLGVFTFPLNESVEGPGNIANAPEGFLGPGSQIASTVEIPQALSRRDFSEIRAGRAAVFLSGRCEYFDFLGEQHVTAFCYYIGGDWGFPAGQAMTPYREGNSFT